MSGQHLPWGLAAAAVYLAAGLIPASRGVPVLPVFDGLAPPEPYRWVAEPPDVPAFEGFEDLEPISGEETIGVDEHFGAFSLITPDGQAQVSMLADAVELPPGEDAISLSLTPLDPASLGPPPDGLRFDSNAYEAEARYEPSGDPVRLTGEATVLLRYAFHGENVLRWDGTAWVPLETTVLMGTLQVFTNSPELGAFVAAGPPLEELGGGFPWPVWVGVGGGAAVLLIGLEVLLRRRRRPAVRRRKRRPVRKKAAKAPAKAKARAKAKDDEPQEDAPTAKATKASKRKGRKGRGRRRR